MLQFGLQYKLTTEFLNAISYRQRLHTESKQDGHLACIAKEKKMAGRTRCQLFKIILLNPGMEKHQYAHISSVRPPGKNSVTKFQANAWKCAMDIHHTCSELNANLLPG